METLRVWSKQHESVADTLLRTGRYTAKRAFIERDLGEHAPLVLEVYDWLCAHSPQNGRPADAEYPVWVSPTREAVMLPSPGTVVLELKVDVSLLTRVNIEKWGAMLNYAYLPADEKDAARHLAMLEARGLCDAQVYMSRFYPELKREITDSWARLFDDSVRLSDNPAWYGNVWEVREEWVTQILR